MKEKVKEWIRVGPDGEKANEEVRERQKEQKELAGERERATIQFCRQAHSP